MSIDGHNNLSIRCNNIDSPYWSYPIVMDCNKKKEKQLKLKIWYINNFLLVVPFSFCCHYWYFVITYCWYLCHCYYYTLTNCDSFVIMLLFCCLTYRYFTYYRMLLILQMLLLLSCTDIVINALLLLSSFCCCCRW